MKKRKRTVYRVLHRCPWIIEKDGRQIDEAGTQAECIAIARDEAKQVEPSQVVVHGLSGLIIQEFTYGDDPFPPKG